MSAGPHALEQIEHFVEGLWAEHPRVPTAVRIRLGIAVGEIAANIIEHATKGLDRLVHLQVWARVRDDHVLIRFEDDGIRAPGEMPTPEMPHVLAERGRGLALARAVLDDLTYERSGDTNRWTLVSQRF